MSVEKEGGGLVGSKSGRGVCFKVCVLPEQETMVGFHEKGPTIAISCGHYHSVGSVPSTNQALNLSELR